MGDNFPRGHISGGSTLPGGQYSWGAYFRGLIFQGQFSRGHFSGGLFSREHFSGHQIFMLQFIEKFYKLFHLKYKSCLTSLVHNWNVERHRDMHQIFSSIKVHYLKLYVKSKNIFFNNLELELKIYFLTI